MSKDAGGRLIIMRNQNKIMAREKPKEEAGEKPENKPREEEKEDFSVLLGTRKKKKPLRNRRRAENASWRRWIRQRSRRSISDKPISMMWWSS